MKDEKDPLEDFTIVTSLSDLGFDDDDEGGNKPPAGDSTPEDKNDDVLEVDPQAQAFYDLLKEEGLINVPDDYKFNGTFEGIKQAQEQTYQYQYQMAQQQLLNSMPEKLRDVVTAGLNGVDDIDQLLTIKKDIDLKVDLSTESSQRNIIRRELSGTISEEDIDELIELYVDKGKLKSEAEKILAKRQEAASTRIEQMQQEAQQRAQQQQQEIIKYRENVNKQIVAQQWDQSRKQLVANEIHGNIQGTPIIEAKLSNIFSNPEHMVVLADFLTYYDGQKFELDKYRKVDSTEAAHLRDKWASKLSDTPVTLKQRQQNRGAISLEDFEIYTG